MCYPFLQFVLRMLHGLYLRMLYICCVNKTLQVSVENPPHKWHIGFFSDTIANAQRNVEKF